MHLIFCTAQNENSTEERKSICPVLSDNESERSTSSQVYIFRLTFFVCITVIHSIALNYNNFPESMYKMLLAGMK